LGFFTIILSYIVGGFVVSEYVSAAKEKKRDKLGWGLAGGGIYLGSIMIVGRLLTAFVVTVVWGDESPGLFEAEGIGALLRLFTIGVGVGISFFVLSKTLRQKRKSALNSK
jgi:hypothetical protein